VEIIDYTGPYEVFGAEKYDVYTVAASKAPVTTSMGMTVVPKYSHSDAPPPDILVVPGGYTPKIRADSATKAWIRKTSQTNLHTISVCNGAFILAEAGLLDGLPARPPPRT
jgi:transcriptional regulator GlxA family with amidase domain